MRAKTIAAAATYIAFAMGACGGQVQLGDHYGTDGGPSTDTDVGSSSGASAGATCAALGGRCVLPSPTPCINRAPNGTQLCNPDLNPGGAFCCLDSLESPDGSLVDDAGLLEGGTSTVPAVAELVCDGTSLPATNVGNTSRLAVAQILGPLPNMWALFEAGNGINICAVNGAPPYPAMRFAPTGGSSCLQTFGDVVAAGTEPSPPLPGSVAFAPSVNGGDCTGASLFRFQPWWDGAYPLPNPCGPGGDCVSGATALATEMDRIYVLTGSEIDTVQLVDSPDGGPAYATTTPCLTSTSVGLPWTPTMTDIAAGHGQVVAVAGDGTHFAILGASAIVGNSGGCTPPTLIASTASAIHAISVSALTGDVAFEMNGNIYVCLATGCSTADLTVPVAASQGPIPPGGLIYVATSPFWVGAQGLSWCLDAAPGTTCAQEVLDANAQPTSGIAIVVPYVYYLQGMLLYRIMMN
jgi:hypothetical protein